MHSSNKNDTTYKIIKLVNGETIIATLTSDDINEIEVQNPLLMNIIPHESEFGERESLNLCRWIEPYTEQKYFTVNKSTIVTTAIVSEGLTRYYEYFIKKLDNWKEENNPESKSFVEEYTDEEIYDEILDSIEVESKSIH
jgi:hypothetical protein|tara:strand:- start:316 stop:735 length:420 start_codon:yes stop_codon:yes gene_type:complete